MQGGLGTACEEEVEEEEVGRLRAGRGGGGGCSKTGRRALQGTGFLPPSSSRPVAMHQRKGIIIHVHVIMYAHLLQEISFEGQHGSCVESKWA